MATNKEKVLTLAAQPLPLPQDCNGLGHAEEPHCGDQLELGLTVNPRRMVVASGFALTQTACATVRAAAVAAAQLALNKPVLAAYTITAADIAAQLSDSLGLDKEHLHCAQMAELALKRAVANYCAG